MAVTTTTWNIGRGLVLEKHTETGSANTALTASVPAGRVREFLYATIKFSATPTYTDSITATLNSGAGAGFDSVIGESTTNSDQDVVITPTAIHGASSAVPVRGIIADDDSLDVDVPAGGVGITASVAIYCIAYR